MPTVYVHGRSERPGDLPDVCMKCGAEGRERVKKTFNWVPPWIGITVLLSPIIYVILALILRKSWTVSVPFCDQHRGHWTNRLLLNLGSLFVLVGGSIGLAVVIANAAGPGGASDMVPLLIIAGIVGWIIVLICTVATSIRCQEITDNGIKLTGVSQEFVEAYQEMEDEERRARRGALDRYEDRRPRRDDRDEDDRPSRRGDRRVREEGDDPPPPPRRRRAAEDDEERPPRRDERTRREDEDY